MNQDDLKIIIENRKKYGSKQNMPAIGQLSTGDNRYDRKLTDKQRENIARVEEAKNRLLYPEEEDLF